MDAAPLVSLDVGTLALSWAPFAMWVRRRVHTTKRLFRDGALLEARLFNRTRRRVRSAAYTTLTLEFEVDSRVVRASLSIGGHAARAQGWLDGSRHPLVDTSRGGVLLPMVPPVLNFLPGVQ